jgi:hypothetical protein
MPRLDAAAHALRTFKNEGLAPDAAAQVAQFFNRPNPQR